MTPVALLIAVTDGGAGLTKPVVDSMTAVVGWVVALLAAGVGVRQVSVARRANVSSDEKEARRDTIADRDAWIKTVTEERDKARTERDRAYEARDNALGERDEARSECDRLREEYRHREQATEAALMVHVPWDYVTYDQAHAAGLDVSPPPPLRPPPDEVHDHGER